MQNPRDRLIIGGFLTVVGAMVLVAVLGAAESVGAVGFFGVVALLICAQTTRPRRRRRNEPEDPRIVLERRLAAGEITAEEYFERDAILRSAPLEMPRAPRRLSSRH